MELVHIVIVEDNKKHREDARRCLGDRVWNPDYLGQLANLRWALREIRELAADPKFSGRFGVLTDLYFPATLQDSHGELAPLGLVVMMECQKLGVPCVIVTAGYHHGPKYHQIDVAIREMGLPQMVDSSNSSEAEAEEKNWKKGLEELEALAAQTGAG